MEKKCSVCGNCFEMKQRQKKIVCSSLVCRREYLKRERVSQNREKYQKVCPQCKNSFEARRSLSLYCSKECAKMVEKEKYKNKYVSKKSGKRTNNFILETKRNNKIIILERDGFRCFYCGKSSYENFVQLHIDHIFPKSRGGKDTAENLITSCGECNDQKGDTLLESESIKLIREIARMRNRKIGIGDKLKIRLG